MTESNTHQPTTQQERLAIAAAMLGKKGGKAKSQAKKITAQENGKKGGRPKSFKITREDQDVIRIQGSFELGSIRGPLPQVIRIDNVTPDIFDALIDCISEVIDGD